MGKHHKNKTPKIEKVSASEATPGKVYYAKSKGAEIGCFYLCIAVCENLKAILDMSHHAMGKTSEVAFVNMSNKTLALFDTNHEMVPVEQNEECVRQEITDEFFEEFNSYDVKA